MLYCIAFYRKSKYKIVLQVIILYNMLFIVLYIAFKDITVYFCTEQHDIKGNYCVILSSTLFCKY